MNQNKVKFIGIGAPKCGTSWLWEMLRQHPDVYLPEKKELHYFNIEAMGDSNYKNPNFYQSIGFYLSHFDSATSKQVCGEITPAYLVSETAPKKIFEFDSQIKLIALLRNPIERSYSDYLYRKQMGWLSKNISFSDACQKYPEILKCSLYCADIKRFLEFFPRKNILILFHDDLRTNCETLLHEVESFIGVRKFTPPNTQQRSNETGHAKYPLLNRSAAILQNFMRKQKLIALLDVLKKSKIGGFMRKQIYTTTPLKNKSSLAHTDKQILEQYFAADIRELEKLTGRTLTHWVAGCQS